MDQIDANWVAQQASRLRLVTEDQLLECWEELGQRGGPAEPLLRALERRRYLTPWQSQKLLRGDTEGFVLGGYRVMYKISSGSFGRVFRAEDPSTGKMVAIKVLRRRWSEDADRISLFEREGKVGQKLRHPNIVEVLAVNRDNTTGQWFIVMEFVEGNNLREFLTIRKKLEPAEALRILEDLVNGLAYAFSQGLTHRDMKLSNILIASSGTAKLVDFGLAGFFAGTESNEDRQERTVDYAGLERATNVKPGDIRSDIYFLGCVFYEMLTGRSPIVTTRDKHQRMQRQRFDNATTISREEVNAPPSVFRLVETMMSMNPQSRYQTPSQLLEAVRACRREMEGGKTGASTGAPAVPSVFLVEQDERLQDAIRDKFKELGYRVFIAADPVRALDRYRLRPFDCLIMDVGTVGEEGVPVFDVVMSEAERHGAKCAGVAILSEEQEHLLKKFEGRAQVAALVRPVTLKQLHGKLKELMA